MNEIKTEDKDVFFKEVKRIADEIKNTRPTAVNLFWAVDRVVNKVIDNREKDIEGIIEIALKEARKMDEEDVQSNRKIGELGSELIRSGDTILTHCNAGSLATCDYGTALGVVRAAHNAGKQVQVFADETRPYLQGSRLTAYELMEVGIPVTVICDNMAGYFMYTRQINCCIVGADRLHRTAILQIKLAPTVSLFSRKKTIFLFI